MVFNLQRLFEMPFLLIKYLNFLSSFFEVEWVSHNLLQWWPGCDTLKAHFNIRNIFPGLGIPILKKKWSWDCLSFVMEIPMLVRQHLYTEMIPLVKKNIYILKIVGCNCLTYLTHWGRDKMAAVSQTTLSNAISWMKMLEFRLRFHWSLFLRVQLTIFQHWFR